MTKKSWLSVIFLVVLAVLYVIFFTNWFRAPTVRVFHTVREIRYRHRVGNNVPELTFGLSRKLGLTEIKVVPLLDYQKDSHVAPAWHLISDSNSIPLKVFIYGQHIYGMKPAVPGAEPQELETNVFYRIFVAAGRIKGQHDFELGGTLSETNAP